MTEIQSVESIVDDIEAIITLPDEPMGAIDSRLEALIRERDAAIRARAIEECAIGGWLHHLPKCGVAHGGPPYDCDCGLNALLATDEPQWVEEGGTEAGE